MEPLAKHLLDPGDHAHLGFHPGCPVCRRQRFFGGRTTDPITAGRAQAFLVSGVLALSAACPVPLIAGEPERHQEGVVQPDQPPGAPTHPESGNGVDAPRFSPGPDTRLVFEVGPSPVTPDGGQNGGAPVDANPLEREPDHDPDAHLVPRDEPESPSTQTENEAPVQPTDQFAAPAPAPETSPPDAETAPFPQQPSEPPVLSEGTSPGEQPQGQPLAGTTDTPPSHAQPNLQPGDRTTKRSPRHPRTALGFPRPSIRSVSPRQAASDRQSVPASYPLTVNKPAGPRATDRVYVVKAGDSLWSIAKSFLGEKASNARVALKVAHLWALNRSRIGTGDPSVLMVGSKLLLR